MLTIADHLHQVAASASFLLRWANLAALAVKPNNDLRGRKPSKQYHCFKTHTESKWFKINRIS